jgi:outer membrane protein assembly factor BamA
VTLIEPWLWKIKLPTSFRLSYKKGTDLTRSLDFKIYSFDASFSREFIKNVRGYVTLGFSKELDKNRGGKDPIFFNPDSNNVLHQVEINSVIINVTNEFDTRNDLFFPTRGFFLQGRIKYSGNPINGLNNYLTFTATWSRFQEMAVEDMIFANRVQLNFLVPLDETPLAKLPLTAPLYLGGSNTIRGYSEGELGQANNVPFGKFSILGNFEIRYPLFWIFRGTVFFDIGNVYPEFVKLKFNILKTTTGVGVTVNTPLGPIRFDYAWRVREGELFSPRSNLKLFAPGQFHLGLLYAF